MSKADEALMDVRRWLCDNLNDGDAGKVCGMLSVVSRRINELEAENDKLRSMVAAVLVLIHEDAYEWLNATVDDVFGKGFTEQARELGIKVSK